MKNSRFTDYLMDFYIVLVLAVFYIAADVIYPILMYRMGIQLSDWWIAANVLVPLIELICCMVIKISKSKNGMDNTTRELLTMMTTVVAGLTGQSLPSFSSGSIGTAASTTNDYEEEYFDDIEEEDGEANG